MPNYNPSHKFEKGHKINKGNTTSSKTINTRFRKLLHESVSDEDFKAVVKVLMDIIYNSNKSYALSAMRLLFQYAVGKPSQEFDVKASISQEEQLESYKKIITKALIESANDDDDNDDNDENDDI